MNELERQIELELKRLPKLPAVQPRRAALERARTAVAQESRRVRRAAWAARFARPFAAAALLLLAVLVLARGPAAAEEDAALADAAALHDLTAALDSSRERVYAVLNDSWLPSATFSDELDDAEVVDYYDSFDESLDFGV